MTKSDSLPDAAVGSMQALKLSNECSPFPQDLPVTLTKSYEILGVVTDCWVQLFNDQIFIGISQLEGKVGTYILCQLEQTPLDSKPSFQVSTLLGKHDDALLEVYARRITERIASLRASQSDPVPPVLLGISLTEKGKDPIMFAEIINVLIKLYSEAIMNVFPK